MRLRTAGSPAAGTLKILRTLPDFLRDGKNSTPPFSATAARTGHMRTIEKLLRARGFNAVRSSVHVNFWPGRFDKLSACKRVVSEAFGGRADDLAPYMYVGDALNDEPMFRGFPRSVGVANVRDVWDELGAKPARVTRRREGAGFEEVVRSILRARSPRRV